MTLEDVRVQVEALMQELGEGKNISMMALICDHGKGDMSVVGDPADLLAAAAVGLGEYMADSTDDFEAVEGVCRLMKSTAEKHMKAAGKVN